MALSIKNRETEALARELAAITHKPLTQAVHDALEREVKRQSVLAHLAPDKSRAKIAMDIGRRSAARPQLSNLNEDEILGYDARGIPSR